MVPIWGYVIDNYGVIRTMLLYGARAAAGAAIVTRSLLAQF